LDIQTHTARRKQALTVRDGPVIGCAITIKNIVLRDARSRSNVVANLVQNSEQKSVRLQARMERQAAE
jgi:hypothetical protein